MHVVPQHAPGKESIVPGPEADRPPRLPHQGPDTSAEAWPRRDPRDLVLAPPWPSPRQERVGVAKLLVARSTDTTLRRDVLGVDPGQRLAELPPFWPIASTSARPSRIRRKSRHPRPLLDHDSDGDRSAWARWGPALADASAAPGFSGGLASSSRGSSSSRWHSECSYEFAVALGLGVTGVGLGQRLAQLPGFSDGLAGALVSSASSEVDVAEPLVRIRAVRAGPGRRWGRPWPAPRSAPGPSGSLQGLVGRRPTLRCTSPSLLYETGEVALAPERRWGRPWPAPRSAPGPSGRTRAPGRCSPSLQVHVAEPVVRDGESRLAWASLGSAFASASLSSRSFW